MGNFAFNHGVSECEIIFIQVNKLHVPKVYFGHYDPVHTGPDPYDHHINLKSLKTSMTLKFVIILQNLIKAYHRKSGKSKCDRKLTELDVETIRIRSRVNGVYIYNEPSGGNEI